MEIILEKQNPQYSSYISSVGICTTANAERLVGNLITISAGATDIYTRGEVDQKIDDVNASILAITPKKQKIVAADRQTSFDMGQAITSLELVTRNGVDLCPNIFTINSPYIVYNASMN